MSEFYTYQHCLNAEKSKSLPLVLLQLIYCQVLTAPILTFLNAFSIYSLARFCTKRVVLVVQGIAFINIVKAIDNFNYDKLLSKRI